jgi:hypothetical protein
VFENIYEAKPGDFKKETIRLYHQKDLPSNIEMGFIPANEQTVFDVPVN